MGLLWVLAAMMVGGFEKTQRGFERVEEAFDRHLELIEAEFRKAGGAWPPRGLFLRAFKDEGELELWALPSSGEALTLVRTFPICQSSGVLGPKVREGDRQVPEGFYVVNRFNPRSAYHLSLGIDYPNAVDRARAGDAPPGGDIFIHGGCVTIGCLPLEDGPIEALYVAAVLARDRGQTTIPVHIFPCRFDRPPCVEAIARSPDLAEFWSVLETGYSHFETHRIPPRVKPTRHGYRFL
jgi:murein L,D-transpeptidase YafK